jgi:coproporphyrinogen III oxidase
VTNQMPTEWLKGLQDRICAGLVALDGSQFAEDLWEREGGGGGCTRILTGGDLFEKAGVNFAEVHGELPADFAAELPGVGRQFRATGVSLVLHPLSPMVPTVHANVRCIRKGDVMWFGGGMDLTPYYAYAEDAAHFHTHLKSVCDGFDASWYARFKPWCDNYFYLPHRDEARGIGGIFFDYVGVAKADLGESVQQRNPMALDTVVPVDRAEAFMKAVGDAFLGAYVPIAERRMNEPWTERERQFQLLRRGRYVEFNLLYDRGTQFGLRTGGRTESILMSLPALVRWEYAHTPEPGSREAELSDFLTARDWAEG